MAAYSSSAAVVNAALELIASQTQVTGLTDGSAAAVAASVVYVPVVQLMLREMDPAFARYTATLTAAPVSAPIAPWAHEYIYPADCVRIRTIRPPTSGTGAQSDANNPMPVRWAVSYDVVSAAPSKVILTNQVAALAVYTTSSVTESQWDSAFGDAVVRRLASALAMGLAGRPDFANTILDQAARMAATGENIDESRFRRPM